MARGLFLRGYMKRKIQAVIGANFGDEGKGRFTDFLVQNMREPIVVRHNSGAQAGHTVEHSSYRHVFHHFGSGTLSGAPTLLCHNFVVNPILFNHEYDLLVKAGYTPKVYLDMSCRMSTFLDMMLNQIVESSRGAAAHGSCGVGFGETIARCELADGKFASHARVRRHDVLGPRLLKYCQEQIDSRGIQETDLSSDEMRSVFNAIRNGDIRWDTYWMNYFLMMDRVLPIYNLREFLAARKEIIFEGAQGLMLHQDHEYFPHVTRCRTGLEDIAELMRICSFEENINAFYATRSYLTRHGNGPLPREMSKPAGVEDQTNVHNRWQGSIRYGQLNYNELLMRCVSDAQAARKYHDNIVWSIAMSCVDQINGLGEFAESPPSIIGMGPKTSETVVNRSQYL